MIKTAGNNDPSGKKWRTESQRILSDHARFFCQMNKELGAPTLTIDIMFARPSPLDP